MSNPNDRSCETCVHRERTALFELCKSPTSQYAIAGKVDFHTVNHMRTRGACGPGGTMHTRTQVINKEM
jgi:hypothetical protein